MMPINLEILEIDGYSFNQPLDNLPRNLKQLMLHNGYSFQKKANFRQSLWNLPASLERLIINAEEKSFDYIKEYIPNLEIIYITD